MVNSIREGTAAISWVSKGGSNPSGLSGKSSFLFGRVVNIALTKSNPLYQKYNILEVIEFEPIENIYNATPENTSPLKSIAFKYNSSVRTPLLNEIVPIYQAPGNLIQELSNQFTKVYYYDNAVGIFISSEVNAAPSQNVDQNKKPGNKIQLYQSSVSGITQDNNVTHNSTTLKLGDYFEERGIRTLAPLEGDYKLEGRFGNSIRFGGTPSKEITKDLNWRGNNVGSPFIMIRNGQQVISGSDPNWAAIYEDINKDGSSVYFLQGQTIDLVLGNSNFNSYKQKADNTVPKQNIVVTTPPTQSAQETPAAQDNKPLIVDPPSASISPSIPSSSMENTIIDGDDFEFLPDTEEQVNYIQIFEDETNLDVNPSGLEKSGQAAILYENNLDFSKTKSYISRNSSDALNDISKVPLEMLKKPKFLLIDNKNKVTPLFEKLEQVAKNIGTNTAALIRVMWAESARTMDPSVVGPEFKNGKYKGMKVRGLIQFTPPTYTSFGYSESDFNDTKKLGDPFKQLDLIQRYFKSFSKGKILSFEDLYFITFFPIALGKPDSFIIESKGVPRDKVYDQNPGIVRAAKVTNRRYLTVGDFKKYLNSIAVFKK